VVGVVGDRLEVGVVDHAHASTDHLLEVGTALDRAGTRSVLRRVRASQMGPITTSNTRTVRARRILKNLLFFGLFYRAYMTRIGLKQRLSGRLAQPIPATTGSPESGAFDPSNTLRRLAAVGSAAAG
jgi:hypothetical protein